MKIELDKNIYTIVDDEVIDCLRGKNIQKHTLPNNRIYACIRNNDATRTYLHRFILGAKDGETVDHVNGDTLDNRISNLRIATQSENIRNCPKRKHSKQPYKGVRQTSGAKTWYAKIKIDGKDFYSCGHKTAKEAAIAYDALAKQKHGIFARLNFPESEE